MGNEQSDRNEEQVFNVIQQIPFANIPYGIVRSAVYAGKDNQAEATQSVTRGVVAPFLPGVADHIERVTIEGDNATGWKTSEEIISRACIGDLIEFDCSVFGHYALYIGDGKVMNVYACGKTDTSALIEERTIDSVCGWLGTKGVRIRNHDHVARNHFNASPKSRDEMLAAANKMKGQTVLYKFIFQNCEFYTTFWRYGAGFSTQVARPTSTPGGFFMPASVMPIMGVSGVLFMHAPGVDEMSVYAAYKRATVETKAKYY